MPSATADERIPAHSSKPSAMAAAWLAPRSPRERRGGDCFEKETPRRRARADGRTAARRRAVPAKRAGGGWGCGSWSKGVGKGGVRVRARRVVVGTRPDRFIHAVRRAIVLVHDRGAARAPRRPPEPPPSHRRPARGRSSGSMRREARRRRRSRHVVTEAVATAMTRTSSSEGPCASTAAARSRRDAGPSALECVEFDGGSPPRG